MAREKRWIVVSPKPELVTRADGQVVSLPRGHEPVALQQDSRFNRLKSQNRLQAVWVEVADQVEAPEVVEVSAEPVVEPMAVAEPKVDRILGFRHNIETALLNAGITSIEALREKVDSDGLESLLELRGIGEGSLEDIRDRLKTD